MYKSRQGVLVPYGLKSLLHSIAKAVVRELPENTIHFISGYCTELQSFRIQNSLMDPRDAVLTFQKIRKEQRAHEQLLSASVADVAQQGLKEPLGEGLEATKMPQIPTYDSAASSRQFMHIQRGLAEVYSEIEACQVLQSTSSSPCESVPVLDVELLQRAPSTSDSGQTPQVMDISLTLDSLLREKESHLTEDKTLSGEAHVMQSAIVPDVELQRAPSYERIDQKALTDCTECVSSGQFVHTERDLSDNYTEIEACQMLQSTSSSSCESVPVLDVELLQRAPSTSDSGQTSQVMDISLTIVNHLPSPPKEAPKEVRSKRSTHLIKHAGFKSNKNLHSKAVSDKVPSPKVSYEKTATKNTISPSINYHRKGLGNVMPASPVVQEGRCLFPTIGKKISLTTSFTSGEEGRAVKRSDSSTEMKSGTVTFPQLNGSSSQSSAPRQPVTVTSEESDNTERFWTLYQLPHIN